MIQKSRNRWRVIAIIFIVLFLVQTAGAVWIVYQARQAVNDEYTCAVNICGGENEAYYFDYPNEICYCFENNEITNSVYLGG